MPRRKDEALPVLRSGTRTGVYELRNASSRRPGRSPVLRVHRWLPQVRGASSCRCPVVNLTKGSRNLHPLAGVLPSTKFQGFTSTMLKRIFLVSAICTAMSAAAQIPQTALDGQRQAPKLTTKTVNPDLIREACIQAIKRDESAFKRIDVTHIAEKTDSSGTAATCMVDARVFEGFGVAATHGTITTSTAQFSVRVDLSTGEANVARVDEAAAREAAQVVLASMFIDMKTVSTSPDKVTYASTIAGKKCMVDVTTQGSGEPKRWLVGRIDCKR